MALVFTSSFGSAALARTGFEEGVLHEPFRGPDVDLRLGSVGQLFLVGDLFQAHAGCFEAVDLVLNFVFLRCLADRDEVHCDATCERSDVRMSPNAKRQYLLQNKELSA